MRKIKYIMSGGLAFSEEEDMEKLRKYSLKGWHVKDFKFMGYTLEKGEREDYIYSLDYRSLKADDTEEYLDFFSSAGWTHIASEADIHLFRARPGTKPIYSDRDTSIEKYSNLNKTIKHVTIPLLLFTTLAWVLALFTTDKLKTVFLIGAIVLSIFALPLAWTLLTAYSNKWKVKGNKGVARLLKTVPLIILFIAVIILLFVYGPDHAVRILTSGVIGAVALPTLIWAIMSIYHKVVGK